MDIIIRPRRLRSSDTIRKLTRETHINKSSLIYPIFVKEGKEIFEQIDTMEGQYRYSPDKICFELEKVCNKGIKNILIFGIPEKKDEFGSSAWDENGIVQKTLKICKREFPQLFYITDVCMCEYTSHGHCGVLDGKNVDNDKTVELLSKISLSYVQAGADMVAPSDMMDGRIYHIRKTLDNNGYSNIPIMAYSAKYASAFYGPFREAASSAPSFGNRKGYQMDYHNKKEALKEVLLDVDEGADIVMIKPALSYLDIISKVSENINIPIAAYSVSGEYSMIKAASKLGYINEEDIICETTTSIYRAGADILITYFAKEIADFIDKGMIG